MEAEPLAIPDVIRIIPRRIADARGFFSETHSAARFAAIGIAATFVQDNHSLSHDRGTIRGLHCQVGPHAQGKLVRCVRGAVWDVAVDARAGSASYGRHVATTLSAADGAQLWIPPGFLHGFLTLEPEAEVLYKVTAPYDPPAERAVRWNDPALALPWPVPPGTAPMLSDRDAAADGFAAARSWFPPP